MGFFSRLHHDLNFIEEKILEELMQYKNDKTSGPDGFNMSFLHKFWHVMKEDIIGLFKEFYESESFVKCLNSSFLVLILKLREQ